MRELWFLLLLFFIFSLFLLVPEDSQASFEATDIEIDTTLEDLEKLNSIIDDLAQLDQDLDTAKDELDASVQDTSDEQLSKSNANMGLIVIVLILIVVILILLLKMRRLEHDGIEAVNEVEDIIIES